MLGAKFRGKFLAYLREAFKTHTAAGKPREAEEILVPPPERSVQQCLNLLNKLGREKWHVQIEPPDTHELLHRMFPDFTGDLCPKCHARLVTVAVIRPGRSPPREKAA